MQEDLVLTLEMLLNRWAIVIQISIVLILVLVFIALWKNFARKVVLSWMLAWIFNLAGLLAIYVVLLGTEYFSNKSFRAIYLTYALCKIWFAILLVHGLSRYLNQNVLLANKFLKLAIISILFVLVIFFLKINTLKIQIIVYTIVGTIFATAGIYHLIVRKKHKRLVLPLMFCLEAGVFLHHAWVLYPTLFGAAVPSYMSHISFLDSISELLLGITCLFAIVYRVIEEYQHSNNEMELAQQSLRQLVDNDPLTGLWNRRKLEDFFNQQNNKGTLIYIDVDNFKTINDTWGHPTGDACLQRIATCLRQVLTSQSGLFRLGGDEFLAVIPDIDDDQLSMSIAHLKSELSLASKTTPSITISIGIQVLNKEIDFNQALKLADESMYKAKKTNSIN
jgi:diguanylate cyclase (GGDEF)-like protein